MAIAFDAAVGAFQDTSGGVSGARTYTFSGASSPTVGTLTNGILLVFLANNSDGDDLTSVTWNGSAMTQINKSANADSAGEDYCYAILSPASGNNSIVVTRNSTGTNQRVRMIGASYQGVNQSLTLDAQSVQTAASTGSVTATLNTVTNNAWKVVFWYDGNGIPSASTNTTSRANDGTNSLVGDSGGPVTPAGAFNMTATGTIGLWTVNEVVLAPAATVIVNSSFFFAASR